MSGFDGLYSFVYGGDFGVGFGLFRLSGRSLNGRDVSGAVYDGALDEQSDSNVITLSVKVVFPPNTYLISGTSPQDLTVTRVFHWVLPRDFANGAPFTVSLPGGPATVMCSRAPEEYGKFESGFVIQPLMRA